MGTILHQPFSFKNKELTIRNRVALAPLTNTQSHDDGTLSESELHWLRLRGQGGFGFIITAAAHVLKTGKAWNGQIGIYDDMHIDGLRRLADALHQDGAKCVVQLFHGGARSPQFVTGVEPWSASSHEFYVGDKIIPVREGTEEDIQNVIDAFVQAARRAIHAGCDGIELHAAHGYLLHQFLSTETNHREDDWGGSLAKRAHIIIEIVRKVQAISPKNFLVGVRISPEDKHAFKGIDFEDSLRLAEILESENIDYLHISTWDYDKRPDMYDHIDKKLIAYFRERIKTPIIVAGNIWSRTDAINALTYGADMIALGRSGIGMADWPKQVLSPDFEPHMPPYSEEHLQKAGLSAPFIAYMTKWKGFVDEG
ncbi:MAG: NADH:flavin oxidoreductase [Saprospiraceae bacterium]